MQSNLAHIVTKRKTGQERFHSGTGELDFTLLDFWQWVASDLISNINRGRLAEFIVARALGTGETDVRREWDVVDLRTEDNIKIEIKSAAYIQSWFQKELSRISFVVPPKHGWDPETNIFGKTSQHHADVYVFALLHHREKQTINPMDLSQWEFYVLPTFLLAEYQGTRRSISFKLLAKLCASRPELCPQPVGFDSLKERIEVAGGMQLERASKR